MRVSVIIILLLFTALILGYFILTPPLDRQGETEIGSLNLTSTTIAQYAGEPILNLNQIREKSPEEAAAVLGQPESQLETVYGTKHLYKNGSIEIVFINNAADWITVRPTEPIVFDASSIQFLGLPPTEPTESRTYAVRWERIPNYIGVSMFPKDGGAVDYFYIKVKTETPGMKLPTRNEVEAKSAPM